MASCRDIAITADQREPIHRETVMAMVARRIEQLVRSGDLKLHYAESFASRTCRLVEQRPVGQRWPAQTQPPEVSSPKTVINKW